MNTRVELRFTVSSSLLLSDDEKTILLEKLKKRINSDGELIIVSQSERSQLRNKEKTIERFYIVIEKALLPVKARKTTKPSRSVVEKRLFEKKLQSEKKTMRKNKIE